MGNNANRNPNDPNQPRNQDPDRKQAPGYDDQQGRGQQGQRSNTDIEQDTDQTRKMPKDDER